MDILAHFGFDEAAILVILELYGERVLITSYPNFVKQINM